MSSACQGVDSVGPGAAVPITAGAPADAHPAAVAAAPSKPLIDKELFRQKVTTKALEIPTQQCQAYLTAFSKWVAGTGAAEGPQVSLTPAHCQQPAVPTAYVQALAQLATTEKHPGHRN